jgi:hypothetical protein
MGLPLVARTGTETEFRYWQHGGGAFRILLAGVRKRTGRSNKLAI